MLAARKRRGRKPLSRANRLLIGKLFDDELHSFMQGRSIPISRQHGISRWYERLAQEVDEFRRKELIQRRREVDAAKARLQKMSPTDRISSGEALAAELGKAWTKRSEVHQRRMDGLRKNRPKSTVPEVLAIRRNYSGGADFLVRARSAVKAFIATIPGTEGNQISPDLNELLMLHPPRLSLSFLKGCHRDYLNELKASPYVAAALDLGFRVRGL